MLRRVAMVCVAVQFAAGLWNTAAAQPAPPPVTLFNSELHEFPTKTGAVYDVYIAFPPGYDPEGDVEYPVLYVTDAFAAFAWTAQTARLLVGGGDIPPLLLVGIDHPVGSGEVFQARRTWNLTPTRDPSRWGEEVPTGGGDEFLATLCDEIIPWVEARYPASQERGLLGHSLGGLFATHVLFTAPSLFTHYLISSPALAWDNEVMFEREEAYASKHQALPGRVFMSVGADEDEQGVMDMLRLSGSLVSRNYPGLVLKRHIFQDETHTSVLGPTISRGLVFLFGNR